MKAVILAGGEGVELRPLTLYTPKPMVNVLNRPVMEYVINLLKQHGITEIAVCAQHFPAMLQECFSDGRQFGVKLSYFIQRKSLGTAGSVKQAEKFLSEDFLVIDGNCLTDIHLCDAIAFHNQSNAAATVVLTEKGHRTGESVIVTDTEGKIRHFTDEAHLDEDFSVGADTGIYILNQKILSYFSAGDNMDFLRDLFPLLLRKKERLFGYQSKGYWCSVADLQAYRQCHRDLLDGKVQISLDGILRDKGVLLEEGAFLEVGATIMPPVYIGKNTYVESGAEILPYSVIGSSCVVGEGARTAGCIVDNGTYLDEGSYTDGAVLGKKVTLKKNAKAYKGSVIGEETVVGAEVIVKPDVKIWPNKKIADDSIVSMSIINSEGLDRHLFGYRGITGAPGVDFTPENIAKISACFGAIHKLGKLAVAYDGNAVSHMAKAAVVSGAMSSGAKVYDFGQNLLAVLRSAVGFYGLKGAVYVSFREKQLQLEFLDGDGANIDRSTEKKLEQLMEREDFARVGSHLMEMPLQLENYKNYYVKTAAKRFALNQIDRFVYLKTESSLVEEYCRQLFGELMIKPIRLKDKVLKNGEITARISENGERLTLYAEDGSEIKNDKLFMLLILILLEGENNQKIVVPPYLSRKAVTLARNSGAQVIFSKNTDAALMKEMLGQQAEEEFRLCFDGVYALSRILEYLAVKKLQLCDITRNLPEVFKARRKVQLPQADRAEVMREMTKHHDGEQLLGGIRITKKDGWVFIVPDDHKASFTIITEGTNEEYARELCDFYTLKLQQKEKEI